jgi:hypothetical protein
MSRRLSSMAGADRGRTSSRRSKTRDRSRHRTTHGARGSCSHIRRLPARKAGHCIADRGEARSGGVHRDQPASRLDLSSKSSSVFSPLCRSPSASPGCPPSLATAWHVHEFFIKCDATGHKTDALTFTLTQSRLRRKKSHAHARSSASIDHAALTALRCSMSKRSECASPGGANDRARRFLLLCTNGCGRFAT